MNIKKMKARGGGGKVTFFELACEVASPRRAT
jgi:hypothetical protein